MTIVGILIPLRGQMVLELQSSHVRHLQIDNQALRDVPWDGVDKFTRGFKSADFKQR